MQTFQKVVFHQYGNILENTQNLFINAGTDRHTIEDIAKAFPELDVVATFAIVIETKGQRGWVVASPGKAVRWLRQALRVGVVASPGPFLCVWQFLDF